MNGVAFHQWFARLNIKNILIYSTISAALGSCLLVISCSSVLNAFPNPPQAMYGQVLLSDGSLLGSGYLIEARINGTHYGQEVSNLGTYSMATRTHSNSYGSNYGVASNFQICSDDLMTVSAIEGGKNGEEIVFFIEGIKASVLRPGIDQNALNSIPYKSGSVVNANLILPTMSVFRNLINTDGFQSGNACKDIWGTPTATPIGTATPTPTHTPRAAAYGPTATPVGSHGDSNTDGTSDSGGGGGGGGGGGFVPPTATPVVATAPNLGSSGAGSVTSNNSSLLPPTPTPTRIPTATPIVIPTPTPILAEIVRGTAVPIGVQIQTSNLVVDTVSPTPSPLPRPTQTAQPLTAGQKLLEEISNSSTDDAVNTLEKESTEDAAVVMESVQVQQAAILVQEFDTKKAAEIVEKVTSTKAAEIVEAVDSNRAAEIVGKVESEKAAEIVEEVGSDKAAEIVSMVDSKKAAEIVDQVNGSKAAEIMARVGDEKAADIVEKVEISQAANIVENVGTEKAVEIVKKVETLRAAEIVGQVESIKAAEIVEKVESVKAAEIVEKVESTIAAKIVEKVESGKAAEIVEKVESLKAAEIVQKVDSVKAASIVEKVGTSKAAEIVSKIESSKAAEIVANVGSQKAADIVQSVEANKAADIVRSVDSSKAAEIVEKVESNAAAGIVGKVESGKAAEIVEKVESTKAAEIVTKVESNKAAEIVGKVESVKAAEIVEKVESVKAAEIVEKVEIGKTVRILAKVGNSHVGKILDSVTSGKVSQVVVGMEEQTLVEKLPEMTASKMFGVPASVLLKALPNVSSEQLVSEIPPEKDIRLPEPIQSVISSNTVSYSVPITVVKNWTKLVGSPKPIDEILVRFNDELPNVQILIERTDTPPYEIKSTCEGFEIYSSFKATLENATHKNISTAHLKIYVEKEWMTQHGIHKWSIAGHIFDTETNSWTQFPSKRISEDADNIYYTFSLPKFGELAISGCSSVTPSKFFTKDLGFTLQKSETEQTLMVKAEVKNTGTEDQNYVAILWVNNSSEMSQSILVPAGESSEIYFEWSAQPGLQNIRVDRLQGEIQIRPILLTQTSPQNMLPSVLVYVLVALSSLGLGFAGLWFILTQRSKKGR